MTHRPQHGEILVSAEEVTEGIHALAEFTVDRYGGDEEMPLFVALLRGGGPFALRLMAAIAEIDPNSHPELEFMRVATYEEGREAKKPRLIADIDERTKVIGRRVVLLDELLDTGTTTSFVSGIVREHGAEAVDVAVLAIKDITRDEAFADSIDGIYHCFEVPEVWVTGMGLDDETLGCEGNRHLPYIAVGLNDKNRG